MNIVDVVIILTLLLGAIVGAKRGFTRQLVDTVGTIAVILLAFLLKGTVSAIFYKVFPFFEFSGRVAGVTSLNLVLYEVISFFLLVVIFYSILSILKLTTNIFEKFLNMTIILGIPSKILGAIVGVIQNFIFAFIVLYVFRLPVFKLDIIKESSVADKMLNSTPVLSNICGNMITTFEDFENLLDEYKNENDKSVLNQKTLELLVDKKIVDANTVNKLIEDGKLKNAVTVSQKEA